MSTTFEPIRTGIEEIIHPTTSASAGYSVFVTGNDNVYAYDNSNSRVNMWSMNLTLSQPVMATSSSCRDLFVDTSSTLYCALDLLHQVVTISLNDPTVGLRRVAGTGTFGSTSDTFINPNGIFVDLNSSLYVADFGNHRVQRFSSGQMNGITIAGAGVSGTITLSYPVHVILDGDGYAFIADSSNHRIVGSGPDGFRCVAGCSGASGSAANKLSNPRSMSFDSYGNIWVADCNNKRVQKFILQSNLCGEHYSSLCNLKRAPL